MDVVLSLRAASIPASMYFPDDVIEKAAASLASGWGPDDYRVVQLSTRRPRRKTSFRSSIGGHHTRDEHDPNHCRQGCRPGFRPAAKTRCSQTELDTSQFVMVVWNPVTQNHAFFVALCQIIVSNTAL